MTYASNKGWGALCKGKLTFGLWSEEESGLHINCLEMLAVCRTILPAGHTGKPCASTCHKSPGRPRLGATLHAGEQLFCVGSDQSVLTEGDTFPGQNEPRSRHVFMEQNLSSEEWTLHPLAVQKIWEGFGRARVDIFASKDNFHGPICFTKSSEALAHEWPRLPLYALPPITLLPQVLS